MGRTSLAVLAVLASAAMCAADVRLPTIFGSNMVVQQQTDAVIWGWARPGEMVRAKGSWSAIAVEAEADTQGRFRLLLPTGAAGGPHTLTVSGDNTIVLSNVLLGEVWLCSGQSNMEWPLAATENAEAAIAAANHPAIRMFTVENTISAHPRLDVNGSWSACSPEVAKNFSAVGYYFALALREQLGDVPIGLIAADWGGTPAESWMSTAGLRAFGEFNDALDFLDAVGKDPGAREQAIRTRRGAWWNSLDRASRIAPQWNANDFDDSAWPRAALPGTWGERGDGLGDFDGVVYYRREIEAPAELAAAGAVLELGPIDDYDDAWVNGVHVGATHADNQWNVARKYAVPEGTLRPGRNIIAVRMLDTAGPGGINGQAEQMVLRSASEGGPRVPLAGEWRMFKGAAAAALLARPADVGITPHTASVLFNGMIAPIAGFPLRGVIWYQGESNVGRAEQYSRLFPSLILDWRAQWAGAGAKTELPFYYVQIAPFNYSGPAGRAAALRDAQRTAMSTPNTGMVVTLDIGDASDIHPRNKRTVGERLARWALGGTYGKKITTSGPMFRTARKEGDTLRVEFDHVDGGLVARGELRGFWIAAEDQKYFRARAKIDGGTVVLSHPRVPRPVAVRYGWENVPTPTLFNAAGLPASSFRSEYWDESLPPPSNDDEMQGYRTREDGFVDLFNGRDLSGWVNVNCAPSTWTIGSDDFGEPVIACSGFPTGVLRTQRMYENFVLELEYRHLKSGGNAGLFVWSDALTARGQPFTRSVEVQVMDGLEGDWYTSDGDIFPIHGAKMTPENGRGGDRAFPTEKRANRAPLWNHYRVTCNNGEITLAVNGKVVTRGRDISPRKGYICLESEGSPVDFRRIRIKELPPAISIHPDQVARADEGFISLYNGIDLAGWKVEPQHVGHWTAKDWTLNFDGMAEGDLWSEKSYSDFVLICDWRWTGEAKDAELPIVSPSGDYVLDENGKQKTQRVKDAGDSGIYLRGSSKSQVNMWCWPIGSGEVHGYRTDSNMPPEVCAGVTPREVADAPIGRWNRFEITMKGDRLTVVLNGKTVIENAQLPGVAREGPIALQAHGSPVQFANIYIRELR
ncbi:MAG: DUF1080 domain-containing protein [Phycisphaeraceae bacterium]|nr:DUF1080 domain-containing protein [Phycisphaeraceae bacterium]